MRMRISINTLMLTGLALVLSHAGFAQTGNLRIEGPSSAEGAVPGQMIEVFVAGISAQLGPPIPLDRFKVLVTQDGVTREAKVRSAALGLMNPQVPLKRPSATSEKIITRRRGARGRVWLRTWPRPRG